MGTRKKVDLVTVSFSGDLTSLALQARSIDRFFDAESLNIIIVVCNDENNREFWSKFQEFVFPEYGRFKERVVTRSAQNCGISAMEKFGWRSQQALKLGVYQSVRTENFVVLDSKNHFVRAVRFGDFVSADGKLRMWRTSARDHLQKYMTGSYEYFGLSANDSYDVTLPTITPFVMNAALIGELDKEIFGRERCSIADFVIRSWDTVTEFYLVNAYVVKRFRSLDVIYDTIVPPVVTLFPDKVQDQNRFDSCMYQISQADRYAFSIHREAFPYLASHQKRQIAQLWIERGLLENETVTEAYLAGP